MPVYEVRIATGSVFKLSVNAPAKSDAFMLVLSNIRAAIAASNNVEDYDNVIHIEGELPEGTPADLTSEPFIYKHELRSLLDEARDMLADYRYRVYDDHKAGMDDGDDLPVIDDLVARIDKVLKGSNDVS